VALGTWASHVLAREVLGSSSELPLVFSPDARLLGLGFAISVATGVIFGLAPALRAIGLARASAMITNQRQAVGLGPMRGMKSLVVGQLALSSVIVFAALLFGRTLVNYTRVEPGFAADRLVTVSFDAIVSGYPADRMTELGERLVTAARSVPGVLSAAVSRCGLIAGCSSSGGFNIEGAGPGNTLYRNWISADYFVTAGIPLLRGRAFDQRDGGHGAPVAIVNETVARRYFPGQDPIGRRLGVSALDTEIVGVVADAHTQTLHDPPVPMLYQPIDQKGPQAQTALTNLDVRVSGDPGAAVPAIREAIRSAEPSLLLDDAAPMSARLARDLNRERLVGLLAFSFAILALILAALGLYGVLSYSVSRRTQEIGVRMALGARRITVMKAVIGHAAMLTAIGLVTGLLGIAAGSRYVAGLLYDVRPLDPVALGGVLLVFLVVTTVAAYLPARRATRIDPLTALRSE
jgi:predicted permease